MPLTLAMMSVYLSRYDSGALPLTWDGFVAAPIWLKKEVAGFIFVGQTKNRLFAADAVRLYEDVARRLSVALENQALLEEAQHRATLLQTAAEVSEAATSFLELEPPP